LHNPDSLNVTENVKKREHNGLIFRPAKRTGHDALPTFAYAGANQEDHNSSLTILRKIAKVISVNELEFVD